MSERPAPPNLVAVYCRVRPERIVLLRHILEGYDNLALPSTVDAAGGLVRLQTPASSAFELMALLEALAPELTPYPAPLPNPRVSGSPAERDGICSNLQEKIEP